MIKWTLSFIAMGLICALVLDVLLILAMTLMGHFLWFDQQYLIGLINIASFPLGFFVSYKLWPPSRRRSVASVPEDNIAVSTLKPQRGRLWIVILGCVAACYVVLAFLSVTRSKTEWRIVRPSDDSFSVLMPGTAQEKSTYATSLAFGKVKANMLILEQGQWCYSVTWVDYPKGTHRDSDADRFLDQGRDGAVEGVQGKLLGEEHVKIEGYSGRKLRIEPASPQATALVNMLVVGDREYSITVVCPKKNSFSSDASKFLDSFRLQTKISPKN